MQGRLQITACLWGFPRGEKNALGSWAWGSESRRHCFGKESGEVAGLAVELRWLYEVSRPLGMGYKKCHEKAESFLFYPRVT